MKTGLNKQRKADLLLVLITGFWGMSYFLTDLCMTGMTPMSLLAFRFVIGFGVLAIVFRKKMWPISRATLKYGVWVGLSLVAVYVFYSYGILNTSLTNAGFICALPVVTTLGEGVSVSCASAAGPHGFSQHRFRPGGS